MMISRIINDFRYLFFVLSFIAIQHSYASDKARLHVFADRPGAWVYLDGQKMAMIGAQGYAKLLVKGDSYSLYVEKTKKDSVFAYRASQEIDLKDNSYTKVRLSLAYGFSKYGQKRWENEKQTVVREALSKIKMVSIPNGYFAMGSNFDSNEQPLTEVTIPSFKIAKHETTFDLYDLFVLDTGYHLPSDNGWGRGKHPVINVSWDDTQQFIAWLNKVIQPHKPYRLPSESEWEYAARAGSTSTYWWGDEIGKNNANCDGCGSLWDDKSTSPVGSFIENPFGLADTAGNVYEWVQDCWNNDYNGLPTDGSARLTGRCERRVLRGGSWSYFPKYIRSADRDYNYFDYRSSNDGFRLAQDG